MKDPIEIRPVSPGSEEQARFLSLPEALYPADRLTASRSAEAELIEGHHVLSPDFTFLPFLALRDGETAARAALIHSGGHQAFFGFFESRQDPQAVLALFSHIELLARQRGIRELTGPVSPSFWTGYRLKTSHFDSEPYFGEPWNLPGYAGLLESAGYEVCDRYYSTFYQPSPRSDPRLGRRLREFREKGYEIYSPRRSDRGQTLLEVYHLLSRLYRSFPAWQPVSEAQFMQLFRDLPLILDFSLLKLARYCGETVGFLVAVPDYGFRLQTAGTGGKLLAILRKRRLKRVVLLYLGANPAHPGLGSALVGAFAEEVTGRKLQVVGALIHEGKVSGGYAGGQIIRRQEYRLYRKLL